MAPSSPTVANWALGQRLREKREELELNGSAAAKLCGGFTPAYLSAIESGQKNPPIERLNLVIDAYEIDDVEAEELRVWREEASHRGWWGKYRRLFSRELLLYFGFEYGAEGLHTFDNGLMNGLLQTEDYARAMIESGTLNLRLAEVDRRLKCRLTRQLRITDEDPLQLSVVMSEAVLRQQVGGANVLRDQLKHLATLIDEHPDTLEVRVVPFEAAGHDALGGSSFHLMSFPSPEIPNFLWQETITTTHLTSDAVRVREYGIALSSVENCALNREESLKLIEKASVI